MEFKNPTTKLGLLTLTFDTLQQQKNVGRSYVLGQKKSSHLTYSISFKIQLKILKYIFFEKRITKKIWYLLVFDVEFYVRLKGKKHVYCYRVVKFSLKRKQIFLRRDENKNFINRV